ncbi:UNVERIFIED_CONTAM: hypothetical protein HDU68_009305 [Siphonaria sp. JEL0065]|nr:hypothetical protein HDU68_009305 [Siphonaria sp. JEL0065]
MFSKQKQVSKIDEGAYGAVFSASDISTPSSFISTTLPATPENTSHVSVTPTVAIKIERNKKAIVQTIPDKKSILLKSVDNAFDCEIRALKLLRGERQIVQFMETGQVSFPPLVYSFIVLELLGPNLSTLQKQCNSNLFSKSTTAMMGRQMHAAIRAVHAAGLVHRDIKPANFCISKSRDDDKTVIKLIDFGLCESFNKNTGRVRDTSLKFRGSVRYASINAHMKRDLGRIDDLWSLFYSLLHFQTGTLPWKKKKEREIVHQLKAACLLDPSLLLCHADEDAAACMQSFMEILMGTTQAQEPEYDLIDACILSLVDDGCGGWEERVFDEVGEGVGRFDWEV